MDFVQIRTGHVSGIENLCLAVDLHLPNGNVDLLEMLVLDSELHLAKIKRALQEFWINGHSDTITLHHLD